MNEQSKKKDARGGRSRRRRPFVPPRGLHHVSAYVGGPLAYICRTLREGSAAQREACKMAVAIFSDPKNWEGLE